MEIEAELLSDEEAKALKQKWTLSKNGNIFDKRIRGGCINDEPREEQQAGFNPFEHFGNVFADLEAHFRSKGFK